MMDPGNVGRAGQGRGGEGAGRAEIGALHLTSGPPIPSGFTDSFVDKEQSLDMNDRKRAKREYALLVTRVTS
jgi:hypothetical protein